jgi:hypothetical protein
MFTLALPSEKIFSAASTAEGHHITIIQGSAILSELQLAPLPGFPPGDYYQKTFSSYPKKQGHGTLLIITLLQNRTSAIPSVKNIYSTSWMTQNNPDSSDFLTIDAAGFWQNLIERGFAVKDSKTDRFKILPI